MTKTSVIRIPVEAVGLVADIIGYRPTIRQKPVVAIRVPSDLIPKIRKALKNV
jgi:hypothetical protein